MVSSKDGFEKLQNTPNLLETLGIQSSPNAEMEFDSILSQSRNEPKRNAQDVVTQGTHIIKTIKGGASTVTKMNNKNMSMVVEPGKLLE
jgi:hypothetical protein